MTTAQTRTRLGKVVGSVKLPLREFTYWPEKNWTTQVPGFVVVAPSGARLTWFPTEQEAQSEVNRKNKEWGAA